jgi:hypothetical protein
MSLDRRGLRYVWIGTMVVLASCLTTTQSPSQSTSKSTGGLSSTEGNSSSLDGFPRTPDPVTVHATLDPTHAADNSKFETPGLVSNWPVDGETADGIKFYLSPDGALLSQDADGNLEPAFGSIITVTPVSAIADLPFSQGYLAAVHIGPDGLLMETAGSLSLTIPGDYDVTKLIGFAADANGEDFHLFPMWAGSSDGTTTVIFSPTHFSLYGVAQATLQEIQAQAAHPPVKPASQDEDDLAPLLPLIDPTAEGVTPLRSKIQLQLGKSYDRLIKRDLDRLPDIPCEKVGSVAWNFNDWKAKVDTAQESAFFEQKINQDATTLLNRLTKCAKIKCDACLNNTPGKKLDKATANSLIILAAFAGDMAGILGRMDEVSYWMQLSSKCNDDAGLPPIYPRTGGDCVGAQCKTSVPLVCKE